jgi:isopenicillin-N N-acyltransferase like protein
MIEPFPVYDVAGSARDCGVAHGELASERVARTIEIYLSAFTQQTKLTLEQVRARARDYASAIEEADPEIVQEIEGIATGSRQRFEDVVAVNCRTELLYGSSGGNRAATECTTIVALPEATRDRAILVGKNWDWRNPCVDAVAVLRVRQTGKPAVTMVLEAGMVGRDGFNEEGIVVCGNLLVSHEDRGKVGVPIPILRRRILHSAHYYEAIERLVRAPRGASGNYLIGHRDGVAINFETSPESVFPLYPERGLLTHSNHFQSPTAHTNRVAKFYTGDSLYRDFRARQLLEPRIGDITVDDLRNTLRDHFGYPRAICRHPHDYPGNPETMTIASLIFDPVHAVLHVAAGQPCCSEYVTVTLPQ